MPPYSCLISELVFFFFPHHTQGLLCSLGGEGRSSTDNRVADVLGQESAAETVTVAVDFLLMTWQRSPCSNS